MIRILNRSPSFHSAVAWIALNDEDASLDVAEVIEQVTVVMVADLYGVDARVVADLIVRVRTRMKNDQEVAS